MAMSEAEFRRARIMTRSAFVFGGLATLLINVAHAESGFGPKITSIIAPISVLFVVELMLLLPTPDSLTGKRLKFYGAGAIGLAALSLSYFHTAMLFISYGEHPFMAWVTPLVPDGMMVMASVGLAYLNKIKESADAEKEAAAAKEAEKLRKAEERKAAAVKRGPTPAQKAQQEARNYILAEKVAGNEVTAKAVAAQFGKSESWSRERIAEVKKASAVKEAVAAS